jgi:peptidoglycan/xylan/chitin deacetylase (PgdA/CDA1 family)
MGTKLALAAAGAVERRLSVVLFHRVVTEPDALLVHEPDIRRFAEQLAWLKASFKILPLPDALDRLYNGCLPAGALAISFDDGYRDNVQNALPVLEQYELPATFFVTSGYLEGGMMWNDRVVEAVRHWPTPQIDLDGHGLGVHTLASGRAQVMEQLLKALKYRAYPERDAIAEELYVRSGAPPARMMMDAKEIRRLRAAGMSIGGHTANHPILHAMSRAGAEREIVENKTALEGILGEQIEIFAYPNGKPFRDFDGREIEILRQSGYRYGLTTSDGTADRHTPPFQIPRFTPWDLRRERYLARMLLNYFRRPQRVPESATA